MNVIKMAWMKYNCRSTLHFLIAEICVSRQSSPRIFHSEPVNGWECVSGVEGEGKDLWRVK